MNKNILNLILAAAISLPFIGQSQTDLPSGSVEIVKSFDARLEETDKINTRPESILSDRKEKRFSYELIPSTVKLDYKMPDIRPLAMAQEKLPGFNKGFVRLGYGWPSSPYAEAAYHLNSFENLEVLTHFRHHSANDSRFENQRFMDNDLEVKGTYYFDQGFALGAHVRYSLDDFYFYGYNQEDTSFAKIDARRRFNTLDGGVRFFNTNGKENDLTYFANLDFYSHSDNFEAKETGAKVHLGVKKFLGGKHPIFADVITDFSTYEDTITQKLNNFFFVPGGAFNSDYFTLHGAVRISSFEDEFYFFPDLRAQVKLAGGAFMINAGWDGNFYKNNFRNLTTYNPFLRPIIPEINNASYYDYYGGFSGISGEWNYELRGGYKTVNNMALYVANFEIPNQFITLFDTVSMIYSKAAVHTTLFKSFTVGLSAGYNYFNPTTQEKAWHIPELDGNLSMTYRTNDKKLAFKTEIYYMNGINVLGKDNTAQKLNTLFDLSFGLDYQFTKNIGAFIHANNLASNRWQRWFDYPTFGINVLGGVSIRF
jgi:hypothetical protein